MAISIPSGAQPHSDPHLHQPHELRPAAALRQVWYWYVALLFIPFVMSLFTFAYLSRDAQPGAPTATRAIWLAVTIGWLLIAAPISFAIRSQMFKSYWRGEAVAPRSYVHGMLIVWLTLEVGGILSLVSCLACHSLTPGVLPALAAFIFYLAMWPDGRSMCKPTGNSDDPEIYSEPR